MAAQIGVGWPVSCLCSPRCGHDHGARVASAFPTAGGLYHWAAILGGRGWGWVTAWFNLAGLVTILAAVNVGTWQFAAAAFGPRLGLRAEPRRAAPPSSRRSVAVVAITVFAWPPSTTRGIRLTTRLTDFSGYWILFTTHVLCSPARPSRRPAMLNSSRKHPSIRNLVTFTNYSDAPGGAWPATGSMPWLFLLGMLLPAVH